MAPSQKQVSLFNEATVLLAALSRLAGRDPRLDDGGDERVSQSNDHELFFKSFINKLCYICDAKGAGKTVTAITLLDAVAGRGVPTYRYLVATNHGREHYLEQTRKHLENILRLAQRATEEASANHQDRTQRRILAEVLVFNKEKVSMYLRYLVKQVHFCLSSLAGELRSEARLLRRPLEELNESLAVSEQYAGKTYVNACIATVQHICDLLNGPAKLAIGRYAVQGRRPDMSHLECWSNLLHVMNRVKAYPEAVAIILKAQRLWPMIFQGATIKPLPSLPALPKQKSSGRQSFTASGIVRHMSVATKSNEDRLGHRLLELGLDPNDVDTSVQAMFDKANIGSVVHAEITILTTLDQRYGTVEGAKFFRGWAYIGASKPTCRLCRYYFEEHGSKIECRPSHDNIYPTWSFPGSNSGSTLQVSPKGDLLYHGVFRRLCMDVNEFLEGSNVPTRKQMDSNTYTATASLDEVLTNF